jgi:hypothetical protein
MRSRATPAGGAATPAEPADGSVERHEALFFSGQTGEASRREHHGRNTRNLFFRLKPMRLNVSETVESLTETPAMRVISSRLCASVAVGRSSRSRWKSLCAVPSTLRSNSPFQP